MTNELYKLIKDLKLSTIGDWELIAIVRHLINNCDWRADFVQTKGFADEEAFNKLELSFDNYENIKATTIFLKDRIKNLSILKAITDNFGDEGGPSTIITLVSKEDLNSTNVTDDWSFKNRVFNSVVKRYKKLYHIALVPI